MGEFSRCSVLFHREGRTGTSPLAEAAGSHRGMFRSSSRPRVAWTGPIRIRSRCPGPGITQTRWARINLPVWASVSIPVRDSPA